MEPCPACGAPLDPRDRFCEECGHSLRARPKVVPPVSSGDQPGALACGDCGGILISADGYCEHCGLRQPSGREHVEIVIPGRAAAVSDRGLRRPRNEDAVAMVALTHQVCAVVCDGVSSAPGSEEAAQLAAEIGAAALAAGLSAGLSPETATRDALCDAAAAVAGLSDSGNPPACTYVSAVTGPDTVTVGWIGDSRAYWLAADSPVQLTHDDSWAAGRTPEETRNDPRAHMITAWLGADAGTFNPHVSTFTPPGRGLVLLCSDGLWNHHPDPVTLTTLVREAKATPNGVPDLPSRAPAPPSANGGPVPSSTPETTASRERHRPSPEQQADSGASTSADRPGAGRDADSGASNPADRPGAGRDADSEASNPADLPSPERQADGGASTSADHSRRQAGGGASNGASDPADRPGPGGQTDGGSPNGTEVGDGDPLDGARRLVMAALQAGGHDNVTVALVPYPPRPLRTPTALAETSGRPSHE
ncbi:protein phosphatase 2C domain-containing protein [Spirillospora sp. CA-294931]|uniref:PP2C family serine/threonine-protein phosphatase n=1 Tax=Spirillospora sp. CA-294931 TaxID=3240042 RepID=UPI003D9110F5